MEAHFNVCPECGNTHRHQVRICSHCGYTEPKTPGAVSRKIPQKRILPRQQESETNLNEGYFHICPDCGNSHLHWVRKCGRCGYDSRTASASVEQAPEANPVVQQIIDEYKKQKQRT